jgi:hypothetical protein
MLRVLRMLFGVLPGSIADHVGVLVQGACHVERIFAQPHAQRVNSGVMSYQHLRTRAWTVSAGCTNIFALLLVL